MSSPKVNITLTLPTSEKYATSKARFLKDGTLPIREMETMRNYFHAVIGGNRPCKMTVQVNSGEEVFSSATVTVSAAAIGDTAVVSGTTFTAVNHKDKSDATVPSDVAGAMNSTYFTFQDQSGRYKYYVWFSINNAGIDPQVAGRIGIKISGATSATGSTLAAACRAACTANIYSVVTFNADSSGNLNNTYIKFKDQSGVNKFYFWFNINGAGVDPAPAGAGTSIAVAGATNATAATLATAAWNAFNATQTQGFRVTNDSSGVIRVYGADGDCPVVQDGVTVATSTQFVVSQRVHGVTISGATTHFIVTNNAVGTATHVVDGAVPSGITISQTITGSAVTSVQYDIGFSDTDAAANLATQINAHTALTNVATATSAAAVTTVSSFYPGVIGNYITLTATTGNTASAATLGSGALSTTVSAVNTYRMGV